MAVMQIETRVLRGATVVFGGKTGVTGNGCNPASDRLPAPCLSVLRHLSRLSPQAGYPSLLRHPAAAPDADAEAARGAGRPRSRTVLGYRGTASSAGRAVQFGWPPSVAAARLVSAKRMARIVRPTRERSSVGRLLMPRHPAPVSGKHQRPITAQFGPTTGAFTASLRGKRAG